MQLEKVYEPGRFEPHWAQWWVESGLYRAEWQPGKPVFSLVIPPPNVTGVLHMGHMLEHTEIDVTVRWHRMKGDITLWVPGTDHAGIATEMVVSRQLQAKGIFYRRDMTREDFEKKVWEWKAESGGTIKRQMIRIGASCDWSRERFTYDPGLSRAVREVFVTLYEKGVIYRGEYMVNWCPGCNTAISDLETVHEETAGHMWHIRYGPLTVATTRPETMLGDTAVAINAKDERYLHLHGNTRALPQVRAVFVEDGQFLHATAHLIDGREQTGARQHEPFAGEEVASGPPVGRDAGGGSNVARADVFFESPADGVGDVRVHLV